MPTVFFQRGKNHHPRAKASDTAMTPKTSFVRGNWGKYLPGMESLAKYPWLSPLAAKLLHPQLWRMQQEALARGAAIGLFWAFAAPAGQVLIAAVHCVWWRANVPVAVCMTMVTNPLSLGFWLWLAYRMGSLVLNEPVQEGLTYSALPAQWLAQYAWPAMVGMALFAIGASVTAYLGVKLAWRCKLFMRRWRRGLGK